MLHRAYHHSSSWHALHQECTRLQEIFARLCYPRALIDRSIKEVLNKYHEPQAESQANSSTLSPVNIILPFASNRQSSKLRRGTQMLGSKLGLIIRPIFTTTRLRQLLHKVEVKDPLIARSRVVYMYTCACDKRYVGFTNRHLHERIAEHQRASSAISKHCQTSRACSFSENGFSVLAKCTSKAECRVRESIEIYFRKPELNAKDEYHCSLLYRVRD